MVLQTLQYHFMALSYILQLDEFVISMSIQYSAPFLMNDQQSSASFYDHDVHIIMVQWCHYSLHEF